MITYHDITVLYVVSNSHVSLYLCNGVFEFLAHDIIERLTKHLVFPISVLLIAIAATFLFGLW